MQKEKTTNEKAMDILNRRAVSRKELIDKLVQKGEDVTCAEGAADWLEEIGLLDDVSYASQIVFHYADRGYGKMRIEQELWRRGVPRNLWQAALDDMPVDTAALDAFIAMRLNGQEIDRAQEKKVTDALYRKGYNWDEIRAGIARYRSSLDEDDSMV